MVKYRFASAEGATLPLPVRQPSAGSTTLPKRCGPIRAHHVPFQPRKCLCDRRWLPEPSVPARALSVGNVMPGMGTAMPSSRCLETLQLLLHSPFSGSLTPCPEHLKVAGVAAALAHQSRHSPTSCSGNPVISSVPPCAGHYSRTQSRQPTQA